MANTKRDEWAKRVRRWRLSGLTAEAFAAREGCAAGTLRWWAWRLGRGEQRVEKFVDATALLVPTASTAVEVVVREAVRIRVMPGFDAEHLRAVVAALESR